MIILVNTNDYLGGGESLLVRIAKNLTQDFKVICKSKSFIESELGEHKEKLTSINGPVNYLYLSKTEKISLVNQISQIISPGAKIITFFMADTILINEVIRKKGIKGCKLMHLYLHPNDYLYGCESIFSKFQRFILGNSVYYSNYIAKDANAKLLKSLDDSKSLVFMNEANFNAHDIDIKNKQIVPLPINFSFPANSPKKFKKKNQVKKIIWVGRIVDFKIPSVVAMCNFVSNTADYEFHIFGEAKSSNDFNNKNENTQSRHSRQMNVMLNALKVKRNKKKYLIYACEIDIRNKIEQMLMKKKSQYMATDVNIIIIDQLHNPELF